MKLINFKAMKTIRNQPRYAIGLRLPVFLKMGSQNCRYSIFNWLQKEQQIEKTKIQLKLARKTLSKP